MMSDDLLLNAQHSNDEADLKDIELCRRVADVLLKYYAGHVWHVEANGEKAGVVNIKLNYPDKLGILPKFGYRLHIDKLSDEKIMRAGGELLERHNLARSKATPYAVIDAINNGCDKAGEVR